MPNGVGSESDIAEQRLVAGPIESQHTAVNMSKSERLRITSYIRKQADHCFEVSRAMPYDYLLDGSRGLWRAIAGALESVATEIEDGCHLDQEP